MRAEVVLSQFFIAGRSFPASSRAGSLPFLVLLYIFYSQSHTDPAPEEAGSYQVNTAWASGRRTLGARALETVLELSVSPLPELQGQFLSITVCEQ